MKKSIWRVLPGAVADLKIGNEMPARQIFIKAGKNSTVNIREKRQGARAGKFVVELEALPGAKVTWFAGLNSISGFDGRRKMTLFGGSSIFFRGVFLSVKAAQETQEIEMRGQNAEADVENVVAAAAPENINLKIFLRHRAPKTRSRAAFRAVAAGKARIACEALTRIDEKAPGSAAAQKIDYLLLAESAEVKAAPRLEINNNDVECKHAVTAGHLDENEIFYIKSRGINDEDAKKIIAAGYLAESLRYFSAVERSDINRKIAEIL